METEKEELKKSLQFSKENFVFLTEGTVLDNYTKEKTLGSGSYGQVYRVKHKITGDLRACKQLTKSRISNLQKFKNEISIMMKADHPSIIKLYEVYEDKRYIYLVMEECKGGELFDKIIERIESGNMFTERQVARIFLQMMSAVAYCHARGICHRDLKPENLLLLTTDEDSPIKIIDFGLSRIYKKDPKDFHKMKTRVGTAYYVSPEVLEGDYDEKCDIWSAGVILYILLCGDPPFNGANDNEIYRAIMRKKYSFDQEKWSNISNEAKDLIKHMICEPDKRYTATQVLEHPWVTNISSQKKGVFTQANIDSFKNYRNSHKLKKAIITFIASRLKDSDVRDLKRTFIDIDSNKDGTVTFDDLKNGMEKIEGVTKNDIEEIFKTIDTDKNGKIEYTEFIAATMDKQIYLREERLADAFTSLDLNHSGKISKDELKKALKITNLDDAVLTKYIEQFDLNGDGEIDYDEFLNMMGKNEI